MQLYRIRQNRGRETARRCVSVENVPDNFLHATMVVIDPKHLRDISEGQCRCGGLKIHVYLLPAAGL